MTALLRFSGVIDGLNRWIGFIVMYGIFVLMAILLWSSVSKTFFVPSLWTLEMAQFAMVAYYMLGGPYSILVGSNVRMDLFYGNWSLRRKATVDVITVFFLIFYLVVLLRGALSSTAYSLGYWGDEPLNF
ncbi:MAG: TRAP transporter small permease subunit, partial [Rhodobacteraceae bacterium]|nr:TRAP transporter small permease subunit [Paracoccaceae bacterium]